MKRPRRNHSAKFKAMIALEAIRGEKTVAQIATHHEVHPNQVTSWKSQLLENAAGIFGGSVASTDSKEMIRELHAKVGELTMERDFSYGPFLVKYRANNSRERDTICFFWRMGNAATKALAFRRWIKLIFARWLAAFHISSRGCLSLRSEVTVGVPVLTKKSRGFPTSRPVAALPIRQAFDHLVVPFYCELGTVTF